MLAGNTLEWFEFVAFGFFAGLFAKLFFPADDAAASILGAFAAFGVTFFVRPLGALYVGHFADRRGRKAGLLLTLSLMALGSAMIAFAPTYSTAGILATLLVVGSRLVQGFSVGGEFGSSTAYLAEIDPQRRGFFGSLQFASQSLTAVMANIIGVALSTSLTDHQLSEWGWRVPFIIGLLLTPIIFYLRSHLNETHRPTIASGDIADTARLLAEKKWHLVASGGAVVYATGATYTLLFLPTYATLHLNLKLIDAFIAGTLTALLQVAIVPIAGTLSDRYGRQRLMLIPLILSILSAYPMFFWLSHSPTFERLLLVQVATGVLLGAYAGVLPSFMSDLFPQRIRVSGLSVSYALTVAIFGGLGPFVNSSVIRLTGDTAAPAYYMTLAAVISLVSIAITRQRGLTKASD